MDVSDVIARARSAQAAVDWTAERVEDLTTAVARPVARPIPHRNMDAEMLFARHFDRYGR